MNAIHTAFFVSIILFSSSALAHHGPIGNPDLYLSENLMELEGEIAEVFWRNPHPRLRLRVASEDGQAEIWELELDGSPISYARRGVTAGDFAQVGDRVRVAGVEALFAPRALGVMHYLRPDGSELVFRDREPRWSAVRYAPPERPLDPEKVSLARQSAQSIFRVWGGRSTDGTAPHPPLSSYEGYLTERGRELAAGWLRARDDPELRCQQGMPTTMFDPVPMEIVDRGDRILIRIQEYDVEREIYMSDGAQISDPVPSPLGTSRGHWEGDTLVVVTTHIDWPQFDPYGTPQSDQTRYVERFRYAEDDEALRYTLTATDPIMFTQPITFERSRPWTPGVELVPFNCAASWSDGGT